MHSTHPCFSPYLCQVGRSQQSRAQGQVCPRGSNGQQGSCSRTPAPQGPAPWSPVRSSVPRCTACPGRRCPGWDSSSRGRMVHIRWLLSGRSGCCRFPLDTGHLERGEGGELVSGGVRYRYMPWTSHLLLLYHLQERVSREDDLSFHFILFIQLDELSLWSLSGILLSKMN